MHIAFCAFLPLQSARGVWRQSRLSSVGELKIPLQSARGVWRQRPFRRLVRPLRGGCNLHGACGGKGPAVEAVEVSHHVAICTGRVEAKTAEVRDGIADWVAICTGRVEAKRIGGYMLPMSSQLQSARGVWRQRIGRNSLTAGTQLQSARGVWRQSVPKGTGFPGTALQSARGVWRQSCFCVLHGIPAPVAICTGRVEAKID